MQQAIRGSLSLCRQLALFMLTCAFVSFARAAELRPPDSVEAGHAFSIPTEGSGQATLYFVGPDHVFKRVVNLGSDVRIDSSDVQSAGQYQMIICQQSCAASTFVVKASNPEYLSFFLHPSRVPVSLPNSIDATALVFDRNSNLVLPPATLDFRITPTNGPSESRRTFTRNGIASIRMNSSSHEGKVSVTAALGGVEASRVIQQVASEACGLRMSASRNANTVTLTTEPVRDCSGNALPDGTIVSFTKVDGAGKSTLDTPIRKGRAEARFSVSGPAKVTVACGVVLGNELSLNGNL